MNFSRFGMRFGGETGIRQLMNDLGRAMAGRDDMRMLGGGNPACIPAVQEVWRRRMRELLDAGEPFDRMLAHYDTPQGNVRFLETLARFFRRQFGWELGPENIAVANGGQTAFFCLLNLLAGEAPGGGRRRILLPLMPEYIGYADQGIEPGLLVGAEPRVEFTGPHRFKYHIDFDRLRVGDDIAALCVSRPTNPTGNVLTDAEMGRLRALARARGIPLIVDNAYGAPFPDILFSETRPVWDPGMVLTYSLSKLGLPGLRTGLVIGPPEIVAALSAMNAILSLAPGGVGQALVGPLFENDEILRLSRETIRPFYLHKSREALRWIEESFDPSLDYHVHESEGAIFLWLWFRRLPIRAEELYERLKRRGVLVVAGSHFFYGGCEHSPHAHECVRLTYSQDGAAVREGIRILAEEVRRAYAGGVAPPGSR